MAGAPGRSDPLVLARELLERSREAGTPDAVDARDRIAAALAGFGYQVETQRFAFSPSALSSLPVLGAGLGWLTLLLIPLLVWPAVPPWSAIAVWATGLAALLLLAAGLALGWATTGAMREDANLIATRGAAIRCWVVAHYDTKSQGHSMAGRLVAVWMLVLAIAGLSTLAVARLAGPLPTWLMAAGAALGMVGAYLAGRGRLRGSTPGARDNGSGIAALLVAAREIRDPSVGILVTGAEEFGLIGARYFAENNGGRLAGTEVINIDTVDERGAWRLVTHRPDGDELLGRAESLLASHSAVPVRRHRLPAGIFVDSLPLARGGAKALTLARLDWGTLRTIHTARDTLAGLSLDSAVLAGRVVGRLASRSP